MSTYDIIFDKNKKYSNNDIVFNDVSNATPTNTGSITLSTILPSLNLSGLVTRYDYRGVLNLGNLNLIFYGSGRYNVNNPFENLNKKNSFFQQSQKETTAINNRFREGVDLPKKTYHKYEEATPLWNGVYSKFDKSVYLGAGVLSKFELSERLAPFRNTQIFEKSIKISIGKNSDFQVSEKLNEVLAKSRFEVSLKVFVSKNESYQKSLPILITRDFNSGVSSLVAHNFFTKFEKAEELKNAGYKISVTPPVIETKSNNDIVFACLANEWEKNPSNYNIIFNDICKLKVDESTDYSEVIFVKNTFSLKNLETGEIVKATSINFSTDRESYSWTGSMSIPDDQIHFLKSPTNKPVLVEYLFNDIKAVLQVGKISRSVVFGQRAYKVTLSSPTVKFDEPTSRVSSYTNLDDIAPANFIETLIDPTNNKINLVWDFLSPLEWVVKAGAFTYQNLPIIKAIGALLKDSGAFVTTSLDGKNLIVKRKRPFMFWESIPKEKIIEIPKVITSLGYEVEYKPKFTGVYILANNRTVNCIRRETNGSFLAPQVVASQLTSNLACVEAGRYVLADTGVVETHDLLKPILNDGVLILPADIIKFTLDNVTYIGTVISVGVDIKFNSQYQTIKVEVIKGFN